VLLQENLARRLVAEGAGTILLLATIVGSGIMAERLSAGNDALALLCNSTATGAMLVILVAVFGPISGAHLNPAVTLAFLVRREITPRGAGAYMLAQIAGAVLGTWLAHLMFGEQVLQISTVARIGWPLRLSEAIAAFGLVLTIFGTSRWRAEMVPLAVGLYIASAYWFTASTSFANPAVTIARSLTDTFTGIEAVAVPGFILAQMLGALAAAAFSGWLFTAAVQRTETGARGEPETTPR
jgi:glycerol uptake facilitator-like aquaporin